ncbi:MAG TPA: L-2-hydroxyglutarate oxidase [Gammaproteobacteria bacterium]|nr:L-2-hydroxyglutarate oxidase [Gammaproteobacteria bacterium]
MADYDCIVIGGGIVGLASALRLLDRDPAMTVAVLEKEDRPAAHQSGHNSGVVHAGVYYEPGSLKARLCRAGLRRTVDFCREHELPFRRCGKLIVATGRAEVVRLQALHRRAQQNGVECRLVEAAELGGLEPNIVGVAAMLVEETGVVDYASICRKMAEIAARRGAAIVLNAEVKTIAEGPAGVRLETTAGAFSGGRVIACAGLQSDRIAKLAGLRADFAIIPFRGDFYRLPPVRADIVEHLIYPVPDPALPFLGVHLTATIDGGITVGPSAMLALKREAYEKFAVSVRDATELLGYRGLWRLLARYPAAGLSECARALSRRTYLRAIRKYCPALELSDLAQHLCGVRAQAVTSDGRLIDDFLIKRTPRTIHICNAPSPAATAALPIADEIVNALYGARRLNSEA